MAPLARVGELGAHGEESRADWSSRVKGESEGSGGDGGHGEAGHRSPSGCLLEPVAAVPITENVSNLGELLMAGDKDFVSPSLLVPNVE